MSKYLEDTQGKIVSNPINETNTKYPFIDEVDGVKPTGSAKLDYQYIANDQLVSDIDTGVYDDYRHTVEDLRHRTETWYENLQKCMVPVQTEGMAFQPYVLSEAEDSQGNITVSKTKALQYFFQDHDVLIGQGSKEYVFRTNQVKFIDDRHRRLIYDRKIHILTLKEDENVTLDELIKRDFFFYRESSDHFSKYVSKTTDINAEKYNLYDIPQLMMNNNEIIMIIDDGVARAAVDQNDLRNHPLMAGQDIDTGIPSSLYNLHNLGWVHPAMIFLNGVAIAWTKILISVDSIDTFVIATHMSDNISNYLDDEKDIEMEYVHIPFKCVYTIGSEDASYTYSIYMNDQNKFDTIPPFIINKDYGGLMVGEDRYKNNVCPDSNCDRVCCVDKSIIFMDMYLDDGTAKEQFLADIGIVHNKSMRSFCDGDYRYKLKRFNFLGFEVNTDLATGTSNTLLTLKNKDFDVTWHPFNILDIKFNHLRNNRRLFKVFYNKEVVYDQDNILRIKNKTEIGEEYERYRKDVTANIETYLNEIYYLTKKDIGSYVVTDKLAYTYGYKYHYITPYETFLIYNEIMNLLGKPRVNFDEFKNEINVSDDIHHKKSDSGGSGEGRYHYDEYVYVEDIDDVDESDIQPNSTSSDDENDTNDDEPVSFVNYINGAFIVYDDEHNFFSEMVKRSTLFDPLDNLRSEIRDFWQYLITTKKFNTITDFLIPIDNERRTDEVVASNAYYIYEGDTRGKIIPFSHFTSYFAIEQIDKKIEYDHLKMRFEFAFIHNMEEGATPMDEMIFYFDNNHLTNLDKYPVVDRYDDRYTANVLNALAWNIFKNDPHNVVRDIVKLNYMADCIIPQTFEDIAKEDYLVTLTEAVPATGYEYQKDPRFFYNFGTYEDTQQTKPKRIFSEWALRRNLPEMFFYALDTDGYTIKSMHLLDEVFDFTYDMNISYIDNLKNGTNYIIGYDADKLEASIKRSIVSITKTGAELKAHKASNPLYTKYTIDGYKMITFIENNNYQLVFNNVLFNLYEEDDGTLTVKYKDENTGGTFVTVVGAGDIDCMYEGLISPLVTINFDNHTVYDIDKDFTSTFVSYRFNHETNLMEFIDGSDNVVVTMQVDAIYTKKKLEMSRWSIGDQDNYVMIFKNHKLYEKYHTIQYSKISFNVDMLDSDAADTDMFEFVFFLNANNTVITKEVDGTDPGETITTEYKSDGTVVYTDTIYNTSRILLNSQVIDPTNLLVLIDTMPSDPNDKWSVDDVANTAYELNHEIYSYAATTDNSGATRGFNYTLQKDDKVNGTYRVTKQGGGDYIVEYSSNVPEKTESYTGDPNGYEYLPDDRSNLGIGTQAFGSPNEITINFNGTVDEWNGLCKANPITVNGGTVICSNGSVNLVEDINAQIIPPTPEPEPEEEEPEETPSEEET